MPLFQSVKRAAPRLMSFSLHTMSNATVGSDWMIPPIKRRSPTARRVRQHRTLFIVSAAALAVVYALIRSDDVLFRLSMATAYASMGLLVFGLVLGPVNVLRRRPNPVSTNLRRDVGIWAGGVALLHVIVGLQVHLRGRMLEYFIDPRSRHALPIRLDAFGAANYTGLVAGLILVLLLALSNDLSLRRLGARRWKTLQRANYFGMGLIVVHGVIYQYVEKRQAYFVALFALLAVIAVGLQFAGYRETIRATRAGQ